MVKTDNTLPSHTTTFSAFSHGIYDACAIPTVLITIYGSKTIQTALFKCILLNGFLLLGSLLVVDRVIAPFLASLSGSLFNRPGTTTVAVPGQPYLSPAEAWANWIGSGLWSVFHLLWVYPLWAASFILNVMWYQKIADRSYSIVYGKAKDSPQTYDWFLKRVSSEIYRVLIMLNYLLLASLVYSFVPAPFGPGIAFILFSWLVSFASFEYKWVQKGWTLEKRIEYFEVRWVYFFGFGLPCTLLTFFLPFFISAGLYAVLFPMYIIMANQSHPLPRTEEIKKRDDAPARESSSRETVDKSSLVFRRLRVFMVAEWMSNTVIYSICGNRRPRPN